MGQSCPPHPRLGAQPTHYRLWMGVAVNHSGPPAGTCSSTCLHWEPKSFCLVTSLPWAFSWGLLRHHCEAILKGEWSFDNTLLHSDSLLSTFPPILGLHSCRSLSFTSLGFFGFNFLLYSELSVERLLHPLWLIVHFIDYSDMSQLTTVYLSCILHIKK